MEDGIQASGGMDDLSVEKFYRADRRMDDHGGIPGRGGDTMGTVAFLGIDEVGDGGRVVPCHGGDADFDEHEPWFDSATEVRKHGRDDGAPGE